MGKKFGEDDIKNKGFVWDPIAERFVPPSKISIAQPEKKSVGNKKIKNATKTTVDGTQYDSKLEAYMAGLLKRHGIQVREKEVFLLQEAFKYGEEKIRAITWSPDFLIPGGIIVEVKGWANDNFPMKLKLFKHRCYQKQVFYKILIVKNKKDCNDALSEILKVLKK